MTDNANTNEGPALRSATSLPVRVWCDVVAFWVSPIRAEPLAVCRIMTGLVLLAGVLLGVAPSLSLYWLPDGLIPIEQAREYGERTGRFSLLYWFPSAPAVITLFVVWVIALGSLTVGFFTRISAVIAFVMTLSFNVRAPWALNGGDDVAAQLLFYLVIAPAGAAWSIDSLRRRLKQYRDPGRGFDLITELQPAEPTLIPPWSVRLMQIQLCFIYFMNGINKFEGPGVSDYISGDALYWILHDTTLIRWPYENFPVPLILCRIAGWITLIFELGFPFLMFWRWVRPWVLLVGFLFHLSILAFMEIGWFGQNTLCFYPVFISAGAVIGFVAWLARCGTISGKRGRRFTLYYDTFCPVCRRSRMAIALFDVGNRIEFRDIHDQKTMQRDLPQVSYSRALSEMIVVTPAGKVHGGFDAFRSVACALPALWPLWPLLYFPGVAWCGRRVYHWVALNRYRLTSCDSGVCSLHLKALQKKNLDVHEIAAVVNNARESAGFARIEPDLNES